MQEEYIKNIIKLLRECRDLELLDFVMRLLQKSV